MMQSNVIRSSTRFTKVSMEAGSMRIYAAVYKKRAWTTGVHGLHRILNHCGLRGKVRVLEVEHGDRQRGLRGGGGRLEVQRGHRKERGERENDDFPYLSAKKVNRTEGIYSMYLGGHFKEAREESADQFPSNGGMDSYYVNFPSEQIVKAHAHRSQVVLRLRGERV